MKKISYLLAFTWIVSTWLTGCSQGRPHRGPRSATTDESYQRDDRRYVEGTSNKDNRPYSMQREDRRYAEEQQQGDQNSQQVRTGRGW